MTKNLMFKTLFVIMIYRCSARPSAGSCSLGGEEYNVGETWQPKQFTCVNCTCLHGGEVNCIDVSCPSPPNCKGPDCDVGVDEAGSHEGELPGCDHHGDHYEDGDVFASNKTAIKPKNNKQCVLCKCFRGKVFCYLQTCLPNPRCRRMIHVDDDCCMQCAEMPSVTDSQHFIPTENSNHTLEEGDCTSASGRHKNGSTWKPVVGEYGEIDCIVCSCRDGDVDCRRLNCPDVTTLTCKQCPERGRQRDKQKRKKKRGKKRKRCKDSKKDRKHGKKNCKRKGKGKKKKTKRKKNKKSSKTKTDAVFKEDMRMVDVFPKLCFPDNIDRIVYHFKGDNFDSVVFDNRKDNSMEHIRWSIQKGRIHDRKRQKEVAPDAIRRNATVADIVGGVRKREFKRFLKRLAKRKKRCKRKCRRRLIDRSVKKIKVVKIDLSRSCPMNH